MSISYLWIQYLDLDILQNFYFWSKYLVFLIHFTGECRILLICFWILMFRMVPILIFAQFIFLCFQEEFSSYTCGLIQNTHTVNCCNIIPHQFYKLIFLANRLEPPFFLKYLLEIQVEIFLFTICASSKKSKI